MLTQPRAGVFGSQKPQRPVASHYLGTQMPCALNMPSRPRPPTLPTHALIPAAGKKQFREDYS